MTLNYLMRERTRQFTWTPLFSPCKFCYQIRGAPKLEFGI